MSLGYQKLALLCAAAATLTACGGGSGSGTNPSAQPAANDGPTVKAAAAPSSSYSLIYQDNFDGTALNQNGWFYRANPSSPYRGGYNIEQNVSVSNGTLKIAYQNTVDANGDGVVDLTGGGIISKRNFGYGYYEARLKLYGGAPGLHQSFWMMGLNGNGAGVPQGYSDLVNAGVMPYYGQTIEIDGLEQNSNSPTGYTTNAHYYLPTHTQVNSQWHTASGGTATWHTLGYEWTPENGGTVRYYLDNILVRTASFNGANGFGQSNVWLTALANTDLSGGVPSGTLSNAYMEVDYFRFYGKNLIGTNRVTNPGFEANKSTMNATQQVGWLKYTPNPNDAASLEATTLYTDTTGTYSHSGYNTLWHNNTTSSYIVTTKQNIENIPNGVYRLTAWVKSSGGQPYAKMRALNYGGGELTATIPASSGWTQLTIDNISVSNNKALIAFTSDANAGQWIKVDDVAFTQIQ